MILKKNKITLVLASILSVFSVITNCGPGYCMNGSGNKSIQVTWDPAHAREVNAVAGGGHKIYYSDIKGITHTTKTIVNVPYSESATSGTITGLNPGCVYYVRVSAYSAINPEGSYLSRETSIKVP